VRRRCKAWLGGAKRCKAYQIWNLLKRKKLKVCKFCLRKMNSRGRRPNFFFFRFVTKRHMNRKDPAWKYAKEIEGEKYLRCAFCDQRCSGGISRLKHHLGQTHHGMQPCKKVPEHVKKECAATLKNLQLEKRKKNEMLREIGDGPGEGALSMETSLDEEYGIPGTRSAAVDETLRAQPKSKGPMDRFVTLEARQSTLNSAYKQEERKEVCRKIGRFFFSRALPFNIVNDPFWLPMVEGIAAYGVGFKPPSMHELRTWILKEEVGDINTMMEEHKKAWAEYGCTIMSDGWTDGKNRVLINFLVNSPAVRKGLEDCMTRMLSFEDRMAADIQLDLYDEAKGEFGSRLAVNSRKLRTPANWWKRFGRDTPELTKFAIRVLSLTCSASGCERNWSTFEQRSIRRRSKIDPILVNEIESDDEWIAEVEEPILPTDLIWLNSQELYDVDVIRNMPTEPYETDLHTRVPISVEPIGDPRTQEQGNIHVRTQEPIVHSRTQDPIIDDDLILDDDVLLSSFASKKRKEGETSSKRKVKSKSIRAMLMDEDDEIDKDPSTFDSGKYPFHIDTVDQYDSDASLNDISVEEWDE
ncbi:unnamed protein product, partial [Prunus brigantina]